MNDSSGKELAYHHAEIARLTAAIAAARPDARTTNALRTKLKHHENRIGRPAGLSIPTTPY
jgi:hypothetical protein